jgi:hypothetical protein
MMLVASDFLPRLNDKPLARIRLMTIINSIMAHTTISRTRHRNSYHEPQTHDDKFVLATVKFRHPRPTQHARYQSTRGSRVGVLHPTRAYSHLRRHDAFDDRDEHDEGRDSDNALIPMFKEEISHKEYAQQQRPNQMSLHRDLVYLLGIDRYEIRYFADRQSRISLGR